jgi:hypothetical protein
MPYKDPEKQREADRRWRVANTEKTREANRRWREANPEKQREATRRWHEANPEKGREQSRRWREANLEKAREANRERVRKWREANPEKKRAYDMAKHPERYRKAYDPNVRPFPACLDLASGQWVRCEQTLLRAPDTSLAARVTAAIIIIEDRLAEAA